MPTLHSTPNSTRLYESIERQGCIGLNSMGLKRLRLAWLTSIFMQSTTTALPYVGMSRYTKVPAELTLKSVVVIHRHGDRAQISKSLGTKYPESADLTQQWTKLLPTDRSCKAMLLAAQPGDALVKHGDSVDVRETLYGGWDKMNIPYAQLTELGSQQLVSVGNELRERYRNFLPTNIAEARNAIFCRSTNTCRTGQSLRSLLVGLFNLDPDAASDEIKPASLQHLPPIHIRPYTLENLYPQGGGPAMIHRRSQIFPPGLEERVLPGYATDEARAQALFRFADKVNWVVVMEVLKCHAVHNIKHIQGATPADLETAEEISAWHWGVLYKDAVLNRLAIGRFLWDLKNNLEASLGITSADQVAPSKSCFGFLGCGSDTTTDVARTEQSATANKRMLIYSGHDSTLVPVLCALGIYDEKWPPYAAHLTLEVAASAARPSEMFVRAVYNGRDAAMFGLDCVWCPLDEFWRNLRRVACSPQEYVEESQRVWDRENEGAHPETSEDIALTSKEVADEIAATITGTGQPASK